MDRGHDAAARWIGQRGDQPPRAVRRERSLLRARAQRGHGGGLVRHGPGGLGRNGRRGDRPGHSAGGGGRGGGRPHRPGLEQQRHRGALPAGPPGHAQRRLRAVGLRLERHDVRRRLPRPRRPALPPGRRRHGRLRGGREHGRDGVGVRLLRVHSHAGDGADPRGAGREHPGELVRRLRRDRPDPGVDLRRAGQPRHGRGRRRLDRRRGGLRPGQRLGAPRSDGAVQQPRRRLRRRGAAGRAGR